jgi:hypothetical protein
MTDRVSPQARVDMNTDIAFTIHLFKEGEMFVAHVPELKVSSCGDTGRRSTPEHS